MNEFTFQKFLRRKSDSQKVECNGKCSRRDGGGDARDADATSAGAGRGEPQGHLTALSYLRTAHTLLLTIGY